MLILRLAAVLAAVAIASVSVNAAAIPCPAVKLSQYDQPGFTCSETINGVDFTFKQFVYQGPNGPSGPLDSQIDVNPISGLNLIGLNFSSFTISGIYMLNYLIDPPPPIIRGEQIDVDPATLTTVVCPSVSPAPCLAPLTLTASTAVPTASITFAPANVLSIQNTFTVLGGTNGFDNRTLLLPPPYPPTSPEPASIALTLSGLVGLGVFRSRAKLRQVFLQLRS